MTDPALWDRLQAFRLDQPDASLTFSRRLARESGWSASFGLRVVEEYKRFVYLAMSAGHEVTPSDQVDQAWHLHLTYTRSYWQEMCRQVLDRPLHHGPTKGGKAEGERFHEQYEQTLASYRREFDCEPPADIWPASEIRFGHDLKFERVNRDDHWVVPKPWTWSTNARRRTASGVALGVAPALLGLANPFDFGGPEFLWFYAILWGIGLVCAIVSRVIIRRDTSEVRQAMNTDSVPDQLTPSEQACLDSGAPGLLRSSIAALLGTGAVEIGQSDPKKFAGISIKSQEYRITSVRPPDTEDPLQIALYEAAQDKVDGIKPDELLKACKTRAQAVETRLQAAGLMESSDSFRMARWVPVSILGSIWLVGLIKLIIGVDRNKPVGFLILALVVGVLPIAALFKRPVRTPAGDAKLDELKASNKHLKKLSVATDTPQPYDDVLLASGLFGLTAVSGASIAMFQSSLQQVKAADGGFAGNSDGGCSSGDGGGGCGGGGCGGCGGCGG